MTRPIPLDPAFLLKPCAERLGHMRFLERDRPLVFCGAFPSASPFRVDRAMRGSAISLFTLSSVALSKLFLAALVSMHTSCPAPQSNTVRFGTPDSTPCFSAPSVFLCVHLWLSSFRPPPKWITSAHHREARRRTPTHSRNLSMRARSRHINPKNLRASSSDASFPKNVSMRQRM
jgi:hypothetical protein